MFNMLDSFTKAKVFEMASSIPPINLINVDQIQMYLLTGEIKHEENHRFSSGSAAHGSNNSLGG